MKQLLRRHPRMVAVIVIVAVAAALGMKLTSHSVPTGAATVQLMVDSPQSSLADLKQDTLPLIARAQVYSQLMSSGAVLDSIARAAHVPTGAVTAEGPYSGAGQSLDVPTPSEARSVQLVATNAAYHFTFVPDANIPMVTVSVQGPTPAGAAKLANAVYPGVRSWLVALQSSGQVPASQRVTVRQLGNAQAGPVNSSSGTTVAGMAAVAVLLVGFLILVALDKRRRAGQKAPGAASDSAPYANAAGNGRNRDHVADDELDHLYGYAAAGFAGSAEMNGHTGRPSTLMAPEDPWTHHSMAGSEGPAFVGDDEGDGRSEAAETDGFADEPDASLQSDQSPAGFGRFRRR